jgi:hypothetical protein
MNATTHSAETSPAADNASATTGSPERVQPSESWVNHFRINQRRDWTIPWDSPKTLAPPSAAAIASSIAEFQRGESSEARNYIARSALVSGRTGDPAFHAASILFVREENGHAALLLRFMQLAGIPPRRKSFADGAFRWLRGFGDMGWSSRVLIIAELIAQEYYPCLRAATDHPALIRICDKIIFDEEAHIRFQVERIVRVEAALGAASLALRDLLLAMLMRGTAVLVYGGHRGVLAPQLSLVEFVGRVVTRNRRAIEAMRVLRKGSTFGLATDRPLRSAARS